MDDLLKLAERCEAAMGPDEQLERDIARHLYGVFYEGIPANVPTQLGYVFPRYTASLDAAMTLFPDGYFPVIDADPRHIEVEVQYLTDETDNGLGACVAAGGKTLALALCAAALRARSSVTVRGE